MKFLKILMLLFLTQPLFAQIEEQVVAQDPKAQEKIKAAHAAYITERLELTSDEAEKFWPVYREYLNKRKELRLQLRQAKESGQDEKALLDLDLKIKQQELDLEKDYTGRLQNVITPQKLIALKQAEGDFRKLLIRQIQQRQNKMERRQNMRERSQPPMQQRKN